MRTVAHHSLRITVLLGLGLCSALAQGGCAPPSDDAEDQENDPRALMSAEGEHEVLALERAALDRWGNGDPGGLLETYAPEITYFDSATKRRIDGHPAMTEYYRPLPGTIKWTRYEIIEPKVQQHGDAAVLTYRLHSETLLGPRPTTDWNSTSVYARIGGEWKMVHSHWSLTALPAAAGIM